MTGTEIAYYFLCHRKLWFFNRNILMEQTNENVAMGKFISESTYDRREHEIKIDDVVLDFFDHQTNTIHEIKKSDKMEEVHVWQVKHYIHVLENKGIENITGKIDYPKLRQTIKVELSDQDREELIKIDTQVTQIIAKEIPPEIINKPFCKQCAYYELCYV